MIIRGIKLTGRFMALVASLVLIMILLLTAVQISVFNLDFFRSEYAKLHTTEVTGITEQELMQSTEVLLSYIRGERDDLKTEAYFDGEKRQVFNQREIDHMADVRILYKDAISVRNAGALIILVLLMFIRLLAAKNFRRFLAVGYLSATAVCLVLFLVLVWAIARDFTGFWNNFHFLFFSNDLWQLDPETDILIQIVPEQFFFDLVVRILLIFGCTTAALAILSGIVLKKKI